MKTRKIPTPNEIRAIKDLDETEEARKYPEIFVISDYLGIRYTREVLYSPALLGVNDSMAIAMIARDILARSMVTQSLDTILEESQ